MVGAFIAAFIAVPVMWHWFDFDRPRAAAGSALVLGVGWGVFAWLQQGWAIGILSFFLAAFLEFAIASVVGLVYWSFASAPRSDHANRVKPAPMADRLAGTHMEDHDVHRQYRRRNLALCALGLLLVPELLLLNLEAERLWSLLQAALPESGYTHILKRCPADVRMLKSQHFAALTIFLPVKAVLVYLCWPLRIRIPYEKGRLESAWGLLVIVLYTLLGMVFAYFVLFELPGRPSLSPGSVLANLHACAQPTLTYALKLSFAAIVAAACLWPVVAIVSSIFHWLFVRVQMHFRPARRSSSDAA